MKWQKLVIYFSISLFLISCGKKKEAAKNEPAPAETLAPAPTSTSAPAAETKPVEAKPAKSEDKKLPVEKVGRDNLDANRKNLSKDKKVINNNQKKTDSKTLNSSSKPSEGSSTIASKDKSSSAIAAVVPQGGIPLTGGVSNFGLLYTGSAEDKILVKLVAMAHDKSSEQQKLDKALASSIFDMSYLVDRTGQLTVDITFVTNGSDRMESRFQMPFEANAKMILEQAALKVTAECIDANKYADDCANLLVTLEKNGAQVKSILRQTKANLWYQVNVVEDEEYNELVQFLRNSKLGYETDNKIDQIYLSSYEVVDGKSGYTAVIMGKAKQVVALKSDLLVKKDLSASLNDVDKATDWNDLNLYMASQNRDVRFMEMYKSAHLTQNNGKGQITVEMKVESKVSKARNKVTLKFTRKAIPAQL